MARRYNIENIRRLLTEGFDVEELRNICFVHSEFRPVYDLLPKDNNKPEIIRRLIEYAEQKENLKFLLMQLEDLNPSKYELHQPYLEKFRVFISYKSEVFPDEDLALQIYEELKDECKIFIDKKMTLGTPWAKRIENEISRSDFLITLLSEASIKSEMVFREIETAYNIAKLKGGTPEILPIRVAYIRAFDYPFDKYLAPVHWTYWKDIEHTPRIIRELKSAFSGIDLPINTEYRKSIFTKKSLPPRIPSPTPIAQLPALESPEGTMDPESEFYIKRPADKIALDTIQRQGVTITIKAPRQMGKSSLLMQIRKSAIQLNKRVAFLDFQIFDQQTLNDANLFHYQFCLWLTEQLGLEDQVQEFWSDKYGYSLRCFLYLENYIIPKINNPFVLVLDEVDAILQADFRNSFFGMLRSCHNHRALEPKWKNLDLALVISTEPNLLIKNKNQSPFNVGTTINLADFNKKQISDLSYKHDLELTPYELDQLMNLLEGHPFLTRKALYVIATKQISSITELFDTATKNQGPFGDHLRNHLFLLTRDEELIQGMRQVLQLKDCSDEDVFYRLQSAGLVKRVDNMVLPRSLLYAEYFGEHLHG